MPTLEPAIPSAKGPGQEIMDDISSAQQYVLDLQAENVALGSVGAAASGTLVGCVDEASSTGQVQGSHGCNGAGPTAVTAALQKHIEDLTQQLENERKERAKLQEQYDQAVAMLRKSYGQIVDDYLFATEQLHVRTKQLEGFMETATTAAGPASDQQQTRVNPAPAIYDDCAAVALTRPQKKDIRDQHQHHPHHRYQGQGPVGEELPGSWDAHSPSPATGREGLIADLVDTAAAALAAAAAAVSAAVPHPTSTPVMHPQPALATDHVGRRLTAGGVRGHLPTAAAGARPSPSSRSSSQSSNANGGGSADATIAAETSVTAGPPEQVAAEEQALLATQRRGKHADDNDAPVLDTLCSGLMSTPGSQSTRPKAQTVRAKVQMPLSHDAGSEPAKNSPLALSSPQGDAPRTSHRPTPHDVHSDTTLVAVQLLPQRAAVAAAAAVPRSQVEDNVVAEAGRHSSSLHREAAESLLAFAVKRIPAEHVGAGAKHSGAPAGVETSVLVPGSGSAEPTDVAITPLTGRADLASARSISGVGPSPFVVPRPELSSRLGTATVGGVSGGHGRSSFGAHRADEDCQSRMQDGQTGGGGMSSLRNSELDHKQDWQHHYRNCDTDSEHEKGRGQSDRQRSGGGAGDARLAAADTWSATANSASKRPEAGIAKIFTGIRFLSEETGLRPVAVARDGDQPDESIWQSPALGPSVASRNAQAAARAAASELRSAAAASAGRRRWDSMAADSERHGDHRDGARNKDGRREDRLTSSAGASTGAANDGIYSPDAQYTPSKDYQHRTPASRRPDADGTHGGRIATGSISQNAAKRLRRSISSPAEHPGRRAGTDAHAREVPVEPVHDANIAPPASTAFQFSNRVTDRMGLPPEPSSIYNAARQPPTVAAAVAESPRKRGGGREGGPPSRKESLRNVQSVPTPGSSELDSSPISHTARDAQGIELEAVSVGAAAMQRVSDEAPKLRNWAAGCGVRAGTVHRPYEASRVNDDAVENSAAAVGATDGVAVAAEAGLDEAEPGKVLPLDLDTYLLRLRTKSAAAGLGVPVAVGGSQATANTHEGETVGLHGIRTGGSGRKAVAATGGAFPCGPSQVAASAAVPQAQVQETATDTAASAVNSSVPTAIAAATSGVFGRSTAAAAKAVAAATTTAAANTPVGAAVRTNGEGCSTTSSPSIEGLASLMRNLRRKLANMAEYNFGVEDLTDDITDGAEDAAGDWLTDDDVDPGGGEFGVDDDDDDDESVLLGIGVGAGVAGSDTAYATGGDIYAGDDDGSGPDVDTGDNDNDVMFGTYDRLYSGTYGSADIAATRRVGGVAAAAGVTAAGTAHREGDAGAPRAQARGGGGAGIANATSSSTIRQFSGPWFGSIASAGSSDAGTPRDSHDYDKFVDGASPKGMEGPAYGSGNGFGSGKSGASFLEEGSRYPQGAAAATTGGKAGSPGADRHPGTEARANVISSLLDSVNAATLGSVGRAHGATRVSSTAAPAPGLVQGNGALGPKRTAPPESAAAAARLAAMAAAASAAGAIATAEERGWSVRSQPDRVPPTDQISPRKDSAASFGQTASGKVPSKWSVSDEGERTGPRATGTAAEAGPDGGSFVSARWANGSCFERDAASAGHANAKVQSVEAAATMSAAAVPTVPASAAASPQLQNLRSEAMFARITQRLDALQNTVSQGLSLPRGTDDIGRVGSRAGSSGSSGGGSGGGGFERGAEHRSAVAAAAAAAAAAWKGEAAWRASSVGGQEARDSGSGGGSGASQGGGLGTSNCDGGMRRDSFRSFAAVTTAGAGSDTKSGGRKLSMRDGGSLSGGAAHGSGEALIGRGDASGVQHHSAGLADWHICGDGINTASKRKTLAAGSGFALGGVATKPHGIVLHGEGDA
ncbi:hypothetical protein Vretimale_3456 [Volvox reticuliferus]|uniref:Uncharacterized protein n=1 Tax=Volvox reticuliferus TaxID=1737510 RepID=A0A8J4DFD4_9CHLO|nr:hypothetical protein Vretimale_3456 [Volvox reticuliferus]